MADRCTWRSGTRRCTLHVDHFRDGQDCQFEPAAAPTPASPADIEAQRQSWGKSCAIRGERQAICAAPAPVELKETIQVHKGPGLPPVTFDYSERDGKWIPRSASPAESQGVERAQPVELKCGQCGHLESRHRLGWPPEACLGATDTDMCLCQKFHVASAAQPVEGPREKCAHTLKTWWKGEGWIQQCTKCGLYFDPSETPSEPADDYRVTVDASYLKSLLRRPPAPVEGVDRATDDRTSDTIPECFCCHYALPNHGHDCSIFLLTRIEVLEAALRVAEEGLRTSYNVQDFPGNGTSTQDEALKVVLAALAAPSGDKEKV